MFYLTRFRWWPGLRPTTAVTDPVPDARAEPMSADGPAPGGVGDRSRTRTAATRVTTALAGLLVLFALIAPNDISRFTPAAFLRIPIEGLLGVALILVLPERPRRVVATLVGLVLGLLTLVKIVDMGFFAVLARPFDLVLDWILFDDAAASLTTSMGRVGAVAVAVVLVVLAAALPVGMTLSVRRLTRPVLRHRVAAVRTVAVLGCAWMVCAVLGVQIVPDAPLAARSAADLVYDRARQVHAGLADREAFAAEAAADAFRDTPASELLTGLRGKDVFVTFVESYGRDAVEDPEFAPQVGAVLEDGDRRLRAAGFSSQSAFLTSPTAGAGSWLAHATLLSGLWIHNQQRYDNLVASDRLTLTGAFRRAAWQTVGVMPAITRAWPEGDFFGYDRVYDSRNLGYRGPRFSYAPMPDQYTLSAFERSRRATSGGAPVMAEIDLISSHAPWAPIPRLIDWDEVGDGSIFKPMAAAGSQPDAVWRDAGRVRTEYRRSIEYSLSTLISYVETYGDDNLVMVFLGDHQPAPIVTGEGASRDVPITVVSRDRAVLDRISGWGWQDGLKPGRDAPVWRMSAFRDRFLTAFGPQPAGSPSPPTR